MSKRWAIRLAQYDYETKGKFTFQTLTLLFRKNQQKCT